MYFFSNDGQETTDSDLRQNFMRRKGEVRKPDVGDIRTIILELCNLAEGLFFPSVLLSWQTVGLRLMNPLPLRPRREGKPRPEERKIKKSRQHDRGGSTEPGEGEPAPHAGVTEGKVGMWRCGHRRHSEQSH